MKKLDRIFWLFVILALFYIIFSLLIPPEAESLTRFNLTPEKARLLKLTVLLPYVMIWYAAFYGYSELRKYASAIKKSQDGKFLSVIADGLMVLAISLPVQACISTVINYWGQRSPDLMDTGTIIANYVDIVFALIAVNKIYTGARGLSQTVKVKNSKLFENLYRIGFVVLALIYSYLTLTNPARQFPTAQSSRAAYYLPDFLLLTTIIVPYLVIWYFWFRSVQHISLYRNFVKGSVYKNALGYLANGIFVIIIARITLRFFSSLTTLFEKSSLGFILVVLYILLALIGAGYVVVALGSKRLKKIEEV